MGTRPPGCKKLVGHKDLWRIRIGQYRVVYYIADTIKLVRVERVSHRKEAYR
ncbi:MAG: type II toxin-antitoxin system RelE/ParE family toxin [Flavobacteriales bacterium]|nr:type II toxin-antitoxin system RelE/ParE family toxin [Flavobacteriales bacterium]MCC6937826.1 type II toxin-antitoxin system RelE/ParE family toxin [Flavobacteriales bacterium]